MKAVIKRMETISDQLMYLEQISVLLKQFPRINGWQLWHRLMGSCLQHVNQLKFIWYLDITG